MKPFEIETFLLKLAPEMPRVHILYSSDLANPLAELHAAAFAGDGGYLGVTTPSLWQFFGQEPGPTMLLNIEAIRDEAGRYDMPFPWYLLKVATHELAHVVDGFPPYYREEVPRVPSPASAVDVLLGQPEIRPFLVPWAFHGADWIRNCLHLRHRADCLGTHFSPWNLVDHHRYGLSSADRYALSLRGEVEAQAGATFAEIRATTPPAAFLDLFEQDIADWQASVDSHNP